MNHAIGTLRRGALVALLFTLLAGCATTAANRPAPDVPARHTAAEFRDLRIAYEPDPWEGFNRSMYQFNYYLDHYLFLPVVHGYEFITPVFVQDRVSDFFNNLGEIKNLTNSVLQLKGGETGHTLARFLTNSTVGLGGLFDPATTWGLERRPEDFGLTLARWGVASGNYLVLPVFGPSSARDAGGLAVDGGISYGIYTLADPFRSLDESFTIEAGVATLDAIDTRHQIPFRYFESGYPFEYEMVRFFTRERRELATKK
ncbi:MlaA family lipoprotein [Geomesophilobacter sediminis]|uniref:VacJ family lipoprotein n=1 Tax=Geomesophilobacter sediminis TaxID=2798584 RepID=A0A8J7JDW3_9BACT|nr:VacJ family lipoprotein [Geomesophilobacter sediminis]MBJ6723969.1 VacJ family lipoprotein [Geomesophilobacter sediminis]